MRIRLQRTPPRFPALGLAQIDGVGVEELRYEARFQERRRGSCRVKTGVALRMTTITAASPGVFHSGRNEGRTLSASLASVHSNPGEVKVHLVQRRFQ